MKRVYIYGAGNVGRAIAAGARAASLAATLRPGIENLEEVGRVLDRMPAGPVSRAAARNLRSWLEWTLRLSFLGESPLDPAQLRRLAGSVPDTTLPEEALVALLVVPTRKGIYAFPLTGDGRYEVIALDEDLPPLTLPNGRARRVFGNLTPAGDRVISVTPDGIFVFGPRPDGETRPPDRRR